MLRLLAFQPVSRQSRPVPAHTRIDLAAVIDNLQILAMENSYRLGLVAEVAERLAKKHRKKK